MSCKPGRLLAHEIADHSAYHDVTEPLIGRIGPAQQHSSAFKSVYDSGDSAVGQSNPPAKLFQAHSLGTEEHLHHASLRPSQLSAGEFRLQRLPQGFTNLADVALDLLRHRDEWLCSAPGPFHRM
jgi:hypothetical protein